MGCVHDAYKITISAAMAKDAGNLDALSPAEKEIFRKIELLEKELANLRPVQSQS